MTDVSLHTTQLHGWLDRMRAGDRDAREELFRRVTARLERLARKMLHRFPDVRRWNETGDVVVNAAMRLDRALRDVRPESVREFFGLAAMLMRRELIDMARRARAPLGFAANHAPAPPDGPPDPPAPAAADDDFDRWSAFHEAVECLPTVRREVVGLVVYHGWTQAEVAGLLGISERHVRRHWNAACLELHDALHAALPELPDEPA